MVESYGLNRTASFMVESYGLERTAIFMVESYGLSRMASYMVESYGLNRTASYMDGMALITSSWWFCYIQAKTTQCLLREATFPVLARPYH